MYKYKYKNLPHLTPLPEHQPKSGLERKGEGKLTHEGIVVATDRLRQEYALLSIRMEDMPARRSGKVGASEEEFRHAGVPAFKPGQFMMIQASDTQAPLLLRPFSIFDVDGGVYRFLIKIVGTGTKAIAGFRYGRRVFLTGPFGNGFPPEFKTGAIVAAGGAGIASVFAFVRGLQARGVPYELIYGARTQDELVLLDVLKPYHTTIATDDGSRGYRGRVPEVLGKKLRHGQTVFACGPLPMLAAVKDVASGHGAACYVSLESRMACGFGVCLGCTVFDVKGNARRVCKEGPVFDAREIAFG